MRAKSTDGYHVPLQFLRNLVTSFAFLTVALLACLAGYSLAAPDLSLSYLTSHGFGLIIAYMLLLWPYYASRHGLLERQLSSEGLAFDIDSVRYGIEYPVYLVLLVATVVLTIIRIYFYQPVYSIRPETVLGILLSVLPFFLVFAASLQNLVAKNKDKAFLFPERVLYPALCTGILPFTFGWAVAGDQIDLSLLWSATIYVLLIIFLAKVSPLHEFLPAALVMLLALLLFVVTQLNVFKAPVLGTVILLAMGVSEASKRVYQAERKIKYYPASQGADYYLAGSNWSSVVFLWCLCLIPLANKELPTYPFLIFAIAQSLTWFYVTDRFKRTAAASNMSLMFGYALPLIIILIGAVRLPVTFLSPSITPQAAFVVFSGIVAFLSFKVFPEIKDFLGSTSVFQASTYLDRASCRALFYIVLAFVIITALVVGIFSGDPQIATKSSEIIGVGSVVFLVLAVQPMIEEQLKRISRNGTATHDNRQP